MAELGSRSCFLRARRGHAVAKGLSRDAGRRSDEGIRLVAGQVNTTTSRFTKERSSPR